MQSIKSRSEQFISLFFSWLVFVYHEHEPSSIFLTGVQLHILLVNLLLATSFN